METLTMKTFDTEIQRFFEIKEELLKLNKELKSLKKLFKENEIDLNEYKKTVILKQKITKFLDSNKLTVEDLKDLLKNDGDI